MTEPQPQFDRETHTYTLGNRVLPSVTEIIKAAGLVDLTWFTEAGRQTGEDVAYLTELYDHARHDKIVKILDERPELEGYFDAWTAFRVDSGFVVQADGIERPVWDAAAGYAGCLDRVGRLNWRPAIVDGKRYAHVPWHGVQLAAYASTFDTPHLRVGVHLKADGKYKLHRFDDDADYDVWKAIVRQFHGRDMPGDARAIRIWKTNHGVQA